MFQCFNLLESDIKCIILLCTNIVLYVAFRGGSALHMASRMGNMAVVDMLLTCQDGTVDVDKLDNNNRTAVYYAIYASR